MLDRYLVIEFILFIIVASVGIRHIMNQNKKQKSTVIKINNNVIKDYLNKYIA